MALEPSLKVSRDSRPSPHHLDLATGPDRSRHESRALAVEMVVEPGGHIAVRIAGPPEVVPSVVELWLEV